MTPVSLQLSKVEQKKLRDVPLKDVNVYAFSHNAIQVIPCVRRRYRAPAVIFSFPNVESYAFSGC